MPALVVIAGPIASGKSTVATALGQRFRAHGRGVAVLDLDDLVETVGGYGGLPPDRFRQAQTVLGRLVGAWLDEGVDVIVHGPFLDHDEVAALLRSVPDAIEPRRVLLQTSFSVALQRMEAAPERLLSEYPEVLEATYDRFERLLPTMPASEWTFDTTATGVEAVVDELFDALLA